MAERPTVVDLVAAVVASEATRPRGDEASPYSWGATLQLAPGHARDTAVAVVEALRRVGQLNSAARLAEFGRFGWTFGWLAGVALADAAVRHVWSPWTVVGVGAVVFAAGIAAAGWVARRAAERAKR